jgi:GAF domain-containing protein
MESRADCVAWREPCSPALTPRSCDRRAQPLSPTGLPPSGTAFRSRTTRTDEKREEVIGQQFSELLGRLTFDEKVLAWVRDALRASHADEKREHEAAIGRLRAEYDRLQARIHAMYVDKEVRTFNDREIELLKSFAAQAVIAIENARLLNELRERTADLSQRTTDLTETLEQQTATAQVLQVINSSPGDLVPVFDAMLKKALDLCEAAFGTLWTYDGKRMRVVAMQGVPAPFAEFCQSKPFEPVPGTASYALVCGESLVHVRDITEDEGYRSGNPAKRSLYDLGGARTALWLPLRKDDALLGTFVVYRQEVRPFTDKQIALLQNFAAQAVIAIENARLLNDLRESLQQQTATADVLKIISRSTFDLSKVLDTLLESAARLCDADRAAITQPKDGVLEFAASFGFPPEFTKVMNKVKFVAGKGTVTGRVLLEGKYVQIDDVLADPEYSLLEQQSVGKYLTVLCVPLTREGIPVGVITLTRNVVRPFTEKQIELVSTFADQAVIAIENARLLNELRQRTDDLTESLEQQTATSEVLRVISSSPGELQPVFDAMLENAVRICDATYGNIYSRDEGIFRLAASYKTPQAFTEYRRRNPMTGSGAHWADPMLRSKAEVHIADLALETGFIERDPSFVAAVGLGGARSALAVPMLKEGEIIGAFALARQEVRPFTEKQIALVTNLAAQAVIAIENTRLLNELHGRTADLTESLKQQTATADVLKVISRSTFELQAVLNTLVESAARLCDADIASIFRPQGSAFQLIANYRQAQSFVDFAANKPIPGGRGTLTGRVMASGQVVHIPDVQIDPEYTFSKAQHIVTFRSGLGVPLIREGTPIGVIVLWRSQVRPFTDKQIELVTTFADQAMIAIENARLVDELRHRTDELGRSVGELRALGSQAVNSTLDLEAVLSTIVARAVQLSNTEAGAIYVFDEMQNEFRLRATYGMEQELIDALTHRRIDISDPNVAAVMAAGEPIQIADLKEEVATDINEITLRAGYRARLVAPLIRGEEVVGMLGCTAQGPRRVCAEHHRSDEDVCSTIGSGDRERSLVSRC